VWGQEDPEQSLNFARQAGPHVLSGWLVGQLVSGNDPEPLLAAQKLVPAPEVYWEALLDVAKADTIFSLEKIMANHMDEMDLSKWKEILFSPGNSGDTVLAAWFEGNIAQLSEHPEFDEVEVVRMLRRDDYGEGPFMLTAEVVPAIQLLPGQTITLDFPELGNMANDEPARCEVRIPENYTDSKRFPIFVWFSGGHGNCDVNSASALVDFDQFIVVAVPYPDGRLPRLGVRDGGIEDFWAFQFPMLERVKALIPNMSGTVRIAGGLSSGAHLLGSAIDLDWPGFTDYFTAYVLHEGGYAPHMTYTGISEATKVLLSDGGQPFPRNGRLPLCPSSVLRTSRPLTLRFPKQDMGSLTMANKSFTSGLPKRRCRI
jgi:hypothetical protein